VTTTHRIQSRRRLDLPSLILLLVGIISGLVAYVLITQGMSALVLIPSVVAATIGATQLTKLEAHRE